MMMKTICTSAAVALFSAITLASGAAPASTFVAWEVTNVPFGDTLNVRKYPSNGSQKQSAYPNGTVLSMTGRCTNGLDLRDIQHLPEHVQAKRVRYSWCQVWHDPSQSGNYVTGWVYGKYIAPN
jgi:hypothetical protein